MIMSIGYMAAQAQADIKFDKMSHDFGTFSESRYTQEPVLPGKTGTIQVTYSGRGKYPGHFSKSITVRSNAKSAERIKLTIEGNMTEAKTKK